MSKKGINLLEAKLKLFDGRRLIIENFEAIKDLTDEYIVVDNYLIRGELLQIKQVTSQVLVIHGKIEAIVLL